MTNTIVAFICACCTTMSIGYMIGSSHERTELVLKEVTKPCKCATLQEKDIRNITYRYCKKVQA